eukprot:s1670_g9.t1
MKKVSHALRIQYPNVIPRPVMRRDLLGAGRAAATSVHSKLRFKGSQKIKQVLAVDDIGDDENVPEDDEAFVEGEFPDDDDESEGVYVTYSEDETLDALLQEIPWDNAEDNQLAEAYATVAQHRMQKRNNQGSPRKSASGSSTMTVPFKAQGDFSFDQKARDQRARATNFLKSVTQCTACLQRGHWVGDPECPKGKGKSKGKLMPKKKPVASAAKKKTQQPANFFVLHEEIQSEGEGDIQIVYDSAPDDGNYKLDSHGYFACLDSGNHYEIEPNDATAENSGNFPAAQAILAVGESTNRFTDSFSCEDVQISPVKVHSVLMVLKLDKDNELCEHSVYFGGDEKYYHRSANGYTRHVTCQDLSCAKTVIKASRRYNVEMWKYLVIIALTTKWGRAARSRELARTIGRLSIAAAAEAEAVEPRVPRQLPVGRAPQSPSGSIWTYVDQASDWSYQSASPAPASPWTVASSHGQPPKDLKAKIVYDGAHPDRAWLYGVLLCMDQELPPVPQLVGEDMAILQPLPADDSLVGHGALAGRAYLEVASVPECEWFCRATLLHALANQPMRPEVFRFAFYLYGRVKLTRSAAVRMMKGDSRSVLKRTADPSAMEASRCIQVPLQTLENDPLHLEPHFCDVMMVEDANDCNDHEKPSGSAEPAADRTVPEEMSYLLQDEESPGLAILDSGCTRTMHGRLWAERFEEKLKEQGKRPKIQRKKQIFRGVGGQTQSECVKAFPITLGGVPGEIFSAETEGSVPLLISRPFMEKLSTVLDLSRGTVSFEAIGVYNLPLLKTSKGHLAVDLLASQPPDQPFALGPSNKDEEHDGYTSVSPGTSPKSEKSSWPPEAYELPDDARSSDRGDHQFHDEIEEDYFEHLRAQIKQLFAGQMGLTLAAVVIGMQVATPLDSSSSSWDAGTSAGVKWMNRDMQVEDPYLTVITHPCGPWGSWSRFNIERGGSAAETVLAKREENRPVLKTVNKVIKQRLKAKRHVFVEQPWGSASLNEPGMEDVRNLIENGELIMIKVDGCMVGYQDAESGLPHQKSSYYLTSMLAAESVFSNHLCDGSHKHQPLEGANCYGPRTAQAAEWPQRLNWMVLEAVIQQAVVESTATVNVHEAFPAQVRAIQDQQQGSNKRPKRKGRVLTLSAPQQAPPVYLRPQAPEDPVPQLDDVPAHEDDSSFRAASASALEPVLSENESIRRHEWLQVDPQLRKILRDLHVNFGHPTCSTLQRILRRQNAKPEAIKAAGLMSCDACGETIRRRRPKPVRLPNRYEFNRHIMADTMFTKDAKGITYAFLNVIDDATGFQMVSCLGELKGVPAAQVILRHLTASWSSWAGLPTSMQVDRGKEYLAEFANYLRQFGVEQEVMPLEAPWKGGKCERAGGLWKDLFYKTVIDSQIEGLSDVILATSIVTQTRNSFPRFNGYSPMQWVLGVGDLRLPGALLDDGNDPNLEVLEASQNPHSEMARTLAVREAARVAQIKMDTDARVRRALLRQSTPTRGPFPVGAYVYFFKAQRPRDDQRNYRGLDLQESSEFASEDELLAAHYVPHYAVQPDQVRGARQYLDVRSHTRPFGEMPHHGLPDGPLPEIQEGDEDTVMEVPAGDTPGQHLPSAASGAMHAPQQPQLEQPPAQPAQLPLHASPSHRRQRTEPEPALEPVPPTPRTIEIQHQLQEATTQESMRGAEALPSALPDSLQPQPSPLPLDFQQSPQTPLNTAMNNPDRLDGLGPSRTRSHIGRSSVSGPYLAEEDMIPAETFGITEDEDWQVICPGMEDSIRRLRLQELLSESEADEFDSYILIDANPAEAFLTGRAVRSEINLKDLNPAERELFDKAMAKEWESWMKFNAVEVLSEEQVAALPQDAEVIGTRWVHVDKNRKTRMMLMATSKKTKKTKEQIDREHPLAAKSRIVVQGNQECDTGIRSDSPTASLLGFNLVCVVAVIHGWLVKSYDASTAYLQAKGIARLFDPATTKTTSSRNQHP